MHDYALVLNAGSSSLKFCVYSTDPRPRTWDLESRGQIDGIGSSPRLSTRMANGESSHRPEADTVVQDQGSALDVVASGSGQHMGARTYWGGAPCGAWRCPLHFPNRYAPHVMAELARLVPLAPLHQPYNWRR